MDSSQVILTFILLFESQKVLYRRSCFYGSTAQMEYPELVSSFDATSLCSGESTARLAILYESDLLVINFSSFSSSEYWIDLHKDSSSTDFFHSRLYESNSTWNANFWDSGSYSPTELCVMYRTDSKFRTKSCSNSKSVMCEIVF
jgi:hypothetical protein